MQKPSVVLIGAGPAGLSAAYEVARLGGKPVVLEAAGTVGGISRTEIHKGYHFDVGGHRFFTKNKMILRLWEEMLDDDFSEVKRKSRIYHGDRFFDYPLRPANTLFNLGMIESLRILASYAKARIASLPEENTFEQWVCNRFGKRLYRIFFKTYTEKVWGIPCHEIRADWAAQRIKGTVSGLLLFFATLWPIVMGNQTIKPFLSLLGQYIIGYAVTIKGAFIGLGYGFIWGFFLGWSVAGLRNLFLALYVYRIKRQAEKRSLKDFLDHF